MKKTTTILLLLLIISALSAFGAVEVSSNSTSGVGTETFTASVTINETSTGNIYVFTDAAHANLVKTQEAAANATTQTYIITGLTGNTDYYIIMNGTSEGAESAVYTAYNSVTTDQYAVSSSGTRTIMGLFVFIIVALFAVYVIKSEIASGHTDIESLLYILASLVIGGMILNAFIVVVLGL